MPGRSGVDSVLCRGCWAAWQSYPSEGGHAEFAPRTDLQIELLRYLKKAFAQKSRVSVERVVRLARPPTRFRVERFREYGFSIAVWVEL